MIFAALPIDPQAIIIFIAVIFAAVKALIERGQKNKEPSPTPLFEDEEEEIDPYESYESELQKQREEMGIPPPLPVRSQAPPPLPVRSQAPQLAPTPKVSIIPAAIKPARHKLSREEKAALENLRLSSLRARKESTISTKARVKEHLSSPTAAREALLLAEIFGPPKALKTDVRF